ncbi:hypothetical protein [Streptomyces sp. NPDC001889]
MPVITLKFAPRDRVQRPGATGPELGTVRTTTWESTDGQGRYYIQWDGLGHARPYTDEKCEAQGISLATPPDVPGPGTPDSPGCPPRLLAPSRRPPRTESPGVPSAADATPIPSRVRANRSAPDPDAVLIHERQSPSAPRD